MVSSSDSQILSEKSGRRCQGLEFSLVFLERFMLILWCGWTPPVIELSTYALEALRKDGEFILYHGRGKETASRVLVLSPVAEYPAPESLKRLEHEYSLREELDSSWAARPIAMARQGERLVLVLEDPGGEPWHRLLGERMDLGRFLRLASNLAGDRVSSTSEASSTRTSNRPTFS
jgi:hypothetical protein